MGKKNSVTKEQIEGILAISKYEDVKMGNNTTVVKCTLPNGYTLISSSCVDPENYDHDLGVELCKESILDRLRYLEEYRLQCDLFAGPMHTESAVVDFGNYLLTNRKAEDGNAQVTHADLENWKNNFQEVE